MAGKQMRFAEYEEKILGLPSICLRYIANDAQAAIDAMPDGENVGYYSDEIMICNQELGRRLKPKKTNRENEYHATLTEIAVILHNAGHDPRELISELRKLTEVDYQAKYEELVEAILLWARRLEITAAILTAIVPWKDEDLQKD